MVTATALHVPAPDLGWLLEGVVQLARRLLDGLTREERCVVEFVRYLARHYGAHLLEARDCDDLERRLNDAVSEPSFLIDRLTLMKHLAELDVDELQPDDDQVEPPAGFSGASLAPLYRQARGLLRVAGEAWLRLLPPEAIARELPKALGGAAEDDLVRVLSELPPQVARLALDGSFADLLTYAVLQVELEELRPEPWLARRVLERLCDALRSYLRLLASIPGSQVDVDVVPPEERLDLEAVFAAHAADERLLDEAAAAGPPSFPYGTPTP